MDVSRRLFLGGAIAVAATAVVSSADASHLPRIYGDGAHDDTVGLQAFLDGKPVRIEGDVVSLSGSGAELEGGTFRVSRPLELRNMIPVKISKTTMIVAPGFVGSGVLRVDHQESGRKHFSDITIKTNGQNVAGIFVHNIVDNERFEREMGHLRSNNGAAFYLI